MKKITSLLLALLFINTSYSEEWYPQYGYGQTENHANDNNYNLSSNINPGVYDAYRYFTVGVGPVVFIPNLGVGYRQRHCQLGWDANLSFSSFGYIHQLSGNVVGLYYLNPYAQNSCYVGLGLVGSGVFTNKGENFGTLSTDFVFGKEFERTGHSRQFLEMHVGVPTLVMGSHREMTYFPLMYVKYGISF